MSLIIFKAEQKHQTKGGAQTEDTGQYTESREIQPDLRREIFMMFTLTGRGPARLMNFLHSVSCKKSNKILVHLLLVESAQHDDCVEEHDDVTA